MLNVKLLVKQYYKSTNLDVVTDGGFCVSAPSDVQVAPFAHRRQPYI